MATPHPYPTIVMRHGQSEANAQHIIASQFKTAAHAYGLTPLGRTQARETALAIKAQFPGAPCIVIASPLLRTQQTGGEVHKILDCSVPLITDHAFIERSFAALELQSDSRYGDVWFYDERNQRVSRIFNHQVEELDSVQHRTQKKLAYYDQRYPNYLKIYITHGDVASNMITTDKGAPLRRHRQVGGLPTAGYYVLAQH